MTISYGSCLCEAIQFEVSDFEPLVGHCHCRMCQKFHGAAFSTFGEVKKTHLTWLKGEHQLKHYQASNESIRSFCKQCGSSLLFESVFNKSAGTIEIALAAFDVLDAPAPDAHIYLKSKVNWCVINDNLSKYQEYRKKKTKAKL